jgi:hypothetical protein
MLRPVVVALLTFAALTPTEAAETRTCTNAANGARLAVATLSDSRVLCSRTVFAMGDCTGGDQLPIFERAWESSSILIVGVKLTFISRPSQLLYVFAGNAFAPDVMAIWNGEEATSTTAQFMPAGTGFPLPAAGAMPWGQDHVDLHLSCSGQFSLYMTWFYTVDTR